MIFGVRICILLLLLGLFLTCAAGATLAGPPAPQLERYVDVPGGRVRTLTVNPQAPGIPLLVLHGGPGASHDYLRNLDALATERPVVFYDQLGCGSSSKPDDARLWTVSRAVEELATVRRALGLERVHLLGQSWGGALAGAYMLETGGPGVESLILCAPLLSTSRWINDQKSWLALMPGNLRAAVERAEASGAYDSPAYQEAMDVYYRRHLCRLSPWPESVNVTMERMNADIYTRMWGPSEFTATGLLKDFDLTPGLGRIKAPTLFVCGEFDEARPETMRFFSSMIPDSEVVVLQGASHMHHLERPDLFFEAVSRFLNRAG